MAHGAEDDDGPHIPTLPACVLIRRWASGGDITAGASSAIQDITLSDLEAEFSTLNIHHGLSTVKANDIVYREVLKDAFDTLPPALANLHDVHCLRQFAGRATITRGRNPLGQVVAAIFRFPKAASDCAVTVHLTPTDKGERREWFFNGRRMVSDQYTAQQDGLLSEKFGPFVVNMAIILKDKRLYLKTQNWRIFGIPLPKFLLPGGEIHEYEHDGRFHFHVDICAPFLGRIVKYEGYLDPTTPALKSTP